jgi:hypothetical protein
MKFIKYAQDKHFDMADVILPPYKERRRIMIISYYIDICLMYNDITGLTHGFAQVPDAGSGMQFDETGRQADEDD